ncbi:MAG: DUF2288 domain-containing protein [Sulfuricella sp.]|nr:DUF2288 domain-containing protein [Sulfuricella sp.]
MHKEIDDDALRVKLNQETSQLAWRELQRFFAAGAVIAVAPGLDLVEVAIQVARDNAASVGEWLSNGGITKISDAQAQDWLVTDPQLWAVVVKPWILVQIAGKRVDPRLH